MNGWLNPDGIDWTTTAGCPRCDEYGPFAPWQKMSEQYRDAHQAWHGIIASLMAVSIVPLMKWLGRRLA